MPTSQPATTAFTAGTRVTITTRGGGRVEGTLLCDADMAYGSTYPVLRTDDGWTYSYRYSIATAPSGREFCPTAGLATMAAS